MCVGPRGAYFKKSYVEYLSYSNTAMNNAGIIKVGSRQAEVGQGTNTPCTYFNQGTFSHLVFAPPFLCDLCDLCAI